MAKFRYYLLLFFLLALGGVLASMNLDGMPKRERAIHTLADALMIAVFLAVTVDAYLKKWLLREAALDVFQFMVGFHLPRGATDRIKTLVQDAALIRRDCELRWILAWVDDKKERVKVRLEVTYFMENSSDKDMRVKQRTAGLDPNDSSATVEAMWFHSSETEHDYHLKGSELQPQPEDAAGNKWFAAPEVIVPSRNRERDLERKFGAKYVSESKWSGREGFDLRRIGSVSLLPKS
jgi:hypothetical protein